MFNRTRVIRASLLCAIVLMVSSVVFAVKSAERPVYQISTINALLHGFYDGAATFDQLKRHGDFGIGTLEALDGEMVMLDNQAYQVTGDGKVHPVADSMQTPFATVAFFQATTEENLSSIQNWESLKQRLDSMITNRNLFYAIRIDGVFRYVKTRSVPKQQKPYPELVEVTKTQPTFEYKDIRGTLIGFWCPQYVQGINVPGYHLHFISNDRLSGGHLLEAQIMEGTVKMGAYNAFHMAVPENSEFATIDLSKNRQQQLKKVEQ